MTTNELTRDELISALQKSVKLQAHYAWMLNMRDHGERIIFKNSDEWVARLIHLKELSGVKEGTET